MPINKLAVWVFISVYMRLRTIAKEGSESLSTKHKEGGNEGMKQYTETEATIRSATVRMRT